MKRVTSVVLASVLICLASCNESTEETKPASETKETFDIGAARTAIDAQNEKFEGSFRSGDTAAIAGLYTTDAVIYPPEMPAITTAEVPATFGAFKRMGIADLALTTTSLTGDANRLIELGTWEIFTADKTKVDNGKFLVLWANDNGTWKISHDVWNTSNAIKRAP